jgi:hypothetical protein
MAGDINRQLVDAIIAKKRLRLVGDNINFTTRVRDERMNRHGKMHHYFGSAVLIHDLSFPNVPTHAPQINISEMKADMFIPNSDEQDALIDDYAIIAIQIAIKHIEYFRCLESLFPKHRPDQYTHQLMKKTVVVPLHVLPYNEQKYGDVVKILVEYVSKMESLYAEAGISKHNMPNIQIGGDQLTRDRFSWAKLLRLGTDSPSDRFDKLKPVSNEFFHMAMKLLAVCFKQLWSTETSGISTLYAQKIRLQRSEVKLQVKDAYNDCKDFFVSYADMHILEAVLSYFNMTDVLSVPVEKCLPADTVMYKDWAMENFRALVKLHAGTFAYKSTSSTPTAGPSGKPSTGHSEKPPAGS